MTDTERTHVLANPMVKATHFSKYFSYWWLNDLFRKGNKRPLEDCDVYHILPDDEAKGLANNLDRLWNKELKEAHSNNRRPRLQNAFIKFLGFQYALQGGYPFAEEALRIGSPLLIGRLLSFFSPKPGISRLDAYITAFVLCLLIFVESMLHAPNFFKNTRSGMRLKIAAGSLIYRKALRLNHASLAKTTTGQIVNLVTSDVQKLEQVTVFFHYIWLSPLLVTVVAFLSWRELGPSVLPGVFLLVCLAPLNGWLGKFFARLRFKTATLTDGRIKVMNEIIAGMRVIKMYTWEKPFAILVAGLRRKETRTVKRTSFLRCINAALYHSVFGIISFAMFTTYVMTGNTLTAEKLFVVLGLFNSCRYVVTLFFPLAVMYLNESLVSEKRLQEFLLLDEREQSLSTRERSVGNEDAPLVQLNHVTAYWDKSLNATLKDISLEAKPGELHIVVGPVGAGKSSLLMTLLGELPVSEGAMTVQGVVGYTSQQAWIFSGTVRENIVFGQQFDEDKYQRVIEACALQKDLELLHNADLTLVGERGVVLSGGQKARLSLARAVYYDADIYLLDDPLSAVDTHVGRELFDKCILTMLKDKICVLVTHQLQYLRDATSIICLQEGRCVGQGSITELSESAVDVRSLISLPESDSDSAIEADHIDIDDMEPRSMTRVSTKSKPEETTQTKPDAVDKDRLTGTVTWKVYFEYWKAGARAPLLILLILLFLGTQALLMVSEWWLAQWADVEETLEFKASLSSNSSTANENPSQMRKHNILIYCFLVLGTFFTAFVSAIVFLFIAVSASQNLHNRMFASILGAPIYFFDTNPVGRVLNRFSKDIGQMDELLPYTFYDYCRLMLMAFAILVLNVVTMPYLLLAAIPLVVLFLYMRNYYLKSAREIKRLEAMNRSPFYSHLSASLQGLTSIRAYSAEARFVHQYHIYQDDHTAPWFLFLTASRWLGSRLDFMCAVFVSFAAFTPLLLAEAGITMSAGIVGLSLTYVRLLIGMFQWCVRQSAEVESLMTSVERVIEYSNLEQELKPHDETLVPPQNWPQYGIITFERLNYTHHHTLPYVLKKVTFCVRSEEKVGIVGRTGAGKSSLMAALFRLAEPEGLVRIDGVPITDVTLHELRSKMSIIPQDPVLFSGSLKKNLDPFNEYGDLELWKALDEVQLKEAVNELPDGLETKLSEGGSNFSVGQRQLVCLARAILKHNKILIIDEATANVDHSTDSLIQETIRTKFKHCTVLTIAHRLNTIMDSDRVLVLDEGKLVEFDEPFLLLQNKNSMFSKMVEHTSKNLATNLYEAAHQAYMLRHETSEDSDTDTRGPSMDELRSSLDACVDRAHVKKQNGGGPEISPPSVARVSCGEKESLLWETSL